MKLKSTMGKLICIYSWLMTLSTFDFLKRNFWSTIWAPVTWPRRCYLLNPFRESYHWPRFQHGIWDLTSSTGPACRKYSTGKWWIPCSTNIVTDESTISKWIMYNIIYSPHQHKFVKLRCFKRRYVCLKHLLKGIYPSIFR